ncbi:cell division protein FtsQ/DivIB [Modestobacter sp. Leaf380]|uniref:cell division protein FtsQ/DivIB n=1 Tax=Modestobacter sp. Leaf380 TaxID=1736356 RepID=UPI0006F992ED|nr:FtsQ-type POTRA domain-containing protein [Modestobacter sp. Leaf380]KQS64855.1 cell division protein FtsQ [Modestobacter sp. Leaf380]
MNRTGSTTRDRTRGARRGASPARSGVTRIRPARRLDRRQRRLLVAGSVLVLVAVAAWVVLASPLLAVRTVQVDGATTLSADQVREVAGVALGTPLVRVDTGSAAARVAGLPQVADAEVSRGWPDRVVVTLRERVAVAVVDQAGTRSLVDAGGTLFDTITGDPPAGVVPVQVTDPGPDDAATRAALAALVSLPGSVRGQLASVAAGTPDDVTLTLADGTSVLWGSAERAERKAEVLTALLDQLAAGTLEPAAQIDVSSPEAVVLR